jgi:argonaute-like protein implicated in RNA metabolism and viral defense
VLYTTGSIEFYSTYPGMYIPQPIGVRMVTASLSQRDIAAEILALTKMNWNQTRLDGRLPVTLRTANQVKAILRFCAPDQAIATRYAHYM